MNQTDLSTHISKALGDLHFAVIALTADRDALVKQIQELKAKIAELEPKPESK